METLTLSPAIAPEAYARSRPRDWRRRALMKTLIEESRGIQSEDVLLSCILGERPDAHTAMIYLDRSRLLSFVRAQGGKTLFPGASEYWNTHESEMEVYVGWFTVHWRGSKLEVALAPAGGSGYAIVIGDMLDDVRSFLMAAESFAERPRGQCLRYSEAWKSSPRMDREIGKVTWEDIVLPAPTMSGIRDSVDGFRDCRKSFEALGFPWRRGMLLVGPPGTGKTMICKAAAAALRDFPFLYVRDLKQRREKDAITEIFERARRLAPCILAFEDLDGFVTDGNRSLFLNELDGFHNNEGILIIASSNHPERIDTALLKRPSRFDRVVHVGLPKIAERRELCRRILSRPQLREKFGAGLDEDSLIEEMARRSEGLTPAYLKEVLLSAALALAQRGVSTLDGRYQEEALNQLRGIRSHMRKMRDPESAGSLDGGEGPLGFRRWEE